MVFLCEFEVYRDRDGQYHAIPFGLAGDVAGRNYREVCEKAAAWLKATAEGRLKEEDTLPELPLGNFPKGGGRILLVAVEPGEFRVKTVYQAQTPRDANRPPALTASRAAEMLGVSRSRISQMTRSGTLEGYRDGRDAYVTIESLNAYTMNSGRRKRSKAANQQLTLF